MTRSILLSLDSFSVKCDGCGNIHPNTWQLMNHTGTDCSTNFSQFCSSLEKFLTSWQNLRRLGNLLSW